MTYVMSASGRAIKWAHWLKAGGCALSQWAEKDAWHGVHPKERNPVTLGAIQDRSVLAAREMASYARKHMGRADWTEVEDRSKIPALHASSGQAPAA